MVEDSGSGPEPMLSRPWTCSHCGSTATLAHGRTALRRGWSRQRTFVCAQCHDKLLVRTLLRLLLWAWIPSLVLAIVALVRVLSTGRTYGTAWTLGWALRWWIVTSLKLTLILAGVGVLVSAIVAVHEMGHALAGRLLGFRVLEVRIGIGPSLKFEMAGTEFVVGVLPLGGGTVVVPRREVGYRWRMTVVVASGLGAEAAALAVALWLGLPAPISVLLTIVVVIDWLANLWPREMTGPLGKISNDGKMILGLLRSELDEARRQMARGYAFEAQRRLEAGDHDGALDAIGAATEICPEEVDHDALVAVACIGKGDLARARELLRGLLDRPDRDGLRHVLDCNNLAWCELLMGDKGDASRALASSTEAFQAMGWQPSVQNTHGLALVVAGRRSEGMRLLGRSLAGVQTPADRAEVLCGIAIGQARSGNLVQARNALGLAAQTHHGSPIFSWAEAEVTGAEDSVAARPA